MYADSKVVILVAARLKSKRLENKAFLPLVDKPILWHVMDRVSRSVYADEIVLCTSFLSSDDGLASFAKKFNFKLFRGEPDNVLKRFFDAANLYDANHIVRVTGDNPLTEPVIIDKMIEAHIDNCADYTYNQQLPRGARAEIIAVNALRKCLRLAEEPGFSEYMSLYFRNYPNVFKNYEYIIQSKDYIAPNFLVTIDTIADYEVVQKIYDFLYNIDNKFDIRSVITFLNSHREIVHETRKKPPLDLTKINTKLKVKQL